jgi:hypothetical protein
MYKMKKLFSFFKNTNEAPPNTFECKVIVKGVNTKNEKPFCLIKVGSFSNNKEGLENAIKAGAHDRYGIDFPEITVVSMKLMPTSKKGDICSYNAVLKQIQNGVLNTYKVIASYRPLPENC